MRFIRKVIILCRKAAAAVKGKRWFKQRRDLFSNGDTRCPGGGGGAGTGSVSGAVTLRWRWGEEPD